MIRIILSLRIKYTEFNNSHEKKHCITPHTCPATSISTAINTQATIRASFRSHIRIRNLLALWDNLWQCMQSTRTLANEASVDYQYACIPYSGDIHPCPILLAMYSFRSGDRYVACMQYIATIGQNKTSPVSGCAIILGIRTYLWVRNTHQTLLPGCEPIPKSKFVIFRIAVTIALL